MRKVASPMPGRYALELAVIEETGWSWQEMQTTPADVIEEILVRRDRRLHWESERAKLDQQKSAKA